MATGTQLIMLSIVLVHGYQVFLALNFNKELSRPSKLYPINALIPLIGLILYFIYSTAIIINRAPTLRPHNGQIVINKWGLNYIWLLVLFYAGTNFFISNRWFIYWRLKKITDTSDRTRLEAAYLIPIKRLINISLWAIGIGFLTTLVLDISKLL